MLPDFVPAPTVAHMAQDEVRTQPCQRHSYPVSTCHSIACQSNNCQVKLEPHFLIEKTNIFNSEEKIVWHRVTCDLHASLCATLLNASGSSPLLPHYLLDHPSPG